MRSRRPLSGLWRCDAGTSAIEFGLIVPILLVMLLGVVDFGRAFIQKMELSSAARAGAQYALLKGYDSDEIQTIVTDSSNVTGISFNTLTTYCECEDGSGVTCGDTCGDGSDNREFVSITVSAPFNAFFFGDLVSSVQATVNLQIN